MASHKFYETHAHLYFANSVDPHEKNGPGGDRAVPALSRARANADEAESEVELQAQLHHAWIMHCSHRAKCARTGNGPESVEIGVIEGIEHFSAELQARGFPRKLDVLEHGDVPSLDARANHDASSGISGGNRSVGNLRKDTRIEELANRLRRSTVGIAADIGPGARSASSQKPKTSWVNTSAGHGQRVAEYWGRTPVSSLGFRFRKAEFSSHSVTHQPAQDCREGVRSTCIRGEEKCASGAPVGSSEEEINATAAKNR